MFRQIRKIAIILFLFIPAIQCQAADGEPLSGSRLVLLISGMIGGLGLFLMGIKMMSESLTKSTGDKIRDLLARLTHNNVVAFFIGIITTMIFQSSSATTVMLVSFVNSRLLKFRDTVAIIFGAAIGATVTIQLIAFRFTDYSLTIIALGFILYVISQKQNLRSISITILGFGILFLGMHLMSESIDPLKNEQWFSQAMLNLENPAPGILTGAALTALIQSSSAFIGILIVLSGQGLISLDAAVPLIIGANIGTAVTAIIASASGSRESKQVALAHTLFKVVGAFIIVWFIPAFIDFIESLTLAGNSPARQIANAHTVFNTIIALLFLPFTNLFSRLVQKLLPYREEKHAAPSTWYIDHNMLHNPSLALSLARQELMRMMEIAQRMTEEIIVPFMEKKCEILQKIRDREKEMNFLRDAINRYLVQIIRQDVTSHQVEEAYQMMYAVDEYEQIGDVLSVNLMDKAEKWCVNNYNFSEEGKKELQDFHQKTMSILYQSFSTFSRGNKHEAVVDAKKSKVNYNHFRQEFFELEKQHYNRLKMDVEESVESSRTHMELIGSLKVIGSHATNIARIILKENKNGGKSPNRGQLEGSA
ncbi:MAG TPA: Na/Pi cotransporter family protein [Bacteroidales bacterium]|nr:Na/Pi cotransporter family protein [Bacteroidales bacterium]